MVPQRNSKVPSYYTPNSELVLEMGDGSHLTVKVLKVFTPFSRSQVSLVTRTTRDLRADRWPWSLRAEAEAEALRRQGTPKQWEYDLPDKDDIVGLEEYCYKRMDSDCSIEVEAYRQLQDFQGNYIPIFYGEAKLLTTDVTRIHKELITPTLAKSFFELIKAFHARGVIHNDLHAGNILVVSTTENDIQTRGVVIDFTEAWLRDPESDTKEEWAKAVTFCADTKFLLRQLKTCLGTEDVESFIGEPIDVYA